MLTGSRTFVGFGFGAIQAGLFLYEAFRSGNFGRLVVAEVLPDVVSAIRGNGGHYAVNIAHADGIERADVGPVEIEDPAVATDRARLVAAIAAAAAVATAVPSIDFYASEGPGSIHRLMAAGLRQKAAQGGPRAVVYAAENHNHAAEILQDRVMAEVPEPERQAVLKQVRFLNTVIGKMSGVKADPAEIAAQSLATTTPQSGRAFLVEAFNSILISRVQFPLAGTGPVEPFHCGIAVFEEKDDLLPFEEAKLYGHNATHALAAYLGAVRGVEFIADLRGMPGVMAVLRDAFVAESGAALIRKHAGVDPLFTPAGYRHYADDLLARMTNPFLRDSVERVGRDPLRKLGWHDRLIGTMRLALAQGVQPQRYALGAAAALAAVDPSPAGQQALLDSGLATLWREDAPPCGELDAVLTLIARGRRQLQRWIDGGFPDLAATLPQG